MPEMSGKSHDKSEKIECNNGTNIQLLFDFKIFKAGLTFVQKQYSVSKL
jgi:hypothetical protein